jgi:hypothetical protein
MSQWSVFAIGSFPEVDWKVDGQSVARAGSGARGWKFQVWRFPAAWNLGFGAFLKFGVWFLVLELPPSSPVHGNPSTATYRRSLATYRQTGLRIAG